MPSIHLRGLSYAHTAAVTVLDDVTLDLAGPSTQTSWIGVVGANGAGKSTLLRLITGELTATSGSVAVQSALLPALVGQSVEAFERDVRDFARTWDGVAPRLRSRLALDPDDLDPAMGRGWSALSPGQRRRWQVAAALAAEPDVLLLDEPTNHLDAHARALLVAALRLHRGLGLIVSHDRALLDELTDRTVRVDRRNAVLCAGSYSQASERWNAEEQSLRRTHVRARRELRRQRQVLADVRRDRHSAEVAPRRQRRLAGASQPDAREAGRKFAQQKAEAGLAARVGQMQSRVQRAASDADAIEVERDHRGAVAFAAEQTGRRVLAHVSGEVARAGGSILLADVDVALERHARVYVRGSNGAGKTTLLRAVADRLVAGGEAVAMLPQEVDAGDLALDRVRSMDPELRGRVLGIAARLGIEPDRLLVSDAPSPGEVRKLRLAELLADTSSVVVLDEPTNHLDLPSIERLEEALASFDGTLLLVTHDEVLAAAVTSSVWHVTDGTVTVSRNR